MPNGTNQWTFRFVELEMKYCENLVLYSVFHMQKAGTNVYVPDAKMAI